MFTTPVARSKRRPANAASTVRRGELPAFSTNLRRDNATVAGDPQGKPSTRPHVASVFDTLGRGKNFLYKDSTAERVSPFRASATGASGSDDEGSKKVSSLPQPPPWLNPRLERKASPAGDSEDGSFGSISSVARTTKQNLQQQQQQPHYSKYPGQLLRSYDTDASPMAVEAPAAGARDDEGIAASGYPRTLLKTNEHSATAISDYPVQVRAALDAIDFSQVTVNLEIDPLGKFAAVVTPTACYVWSYALGSAVTNVFELPLPDPADATSYDTPLVSLIPADEDSQSSDLDVGVMVCSPDGQLRYWERVAFGLGGVERFLTLDLPVPESDVCCSLVKAGRSGHVVATRLGTLYWVTVHQESGQSGGARLSAKPLSKDEALASRHGLFARVSSLFSGSQTVGHSVLQDSSESIVSLAVSGFTSSRQTHDVYVLTPRSLQKWVISDRVPSQCVYTVDLLSKLSEGASRTIPGDAALYLLDVTVAEDGTLYVLAGQQDPSHPSHKLVVGALSPVNDSGAFVFDQVRRLTFALPEAFDTEGPYRPRIVLPNGGPGLFIVVPEAIVLSTTFGTASDARFEETIKFRSGDFVLGFGSSRGFLASQPNSCQACTVTVASVSTGLIEVLINLGYIFQTMAASPMAPELVPPDYDMADAGDQTFQSEVIRHQRQIEQAVFFASENSNNPLAFRITPAGSSAPDATDQALEAAALNVSTSIVDGSSPYLAEMLGLLPRLDERVQLAHSVIRFISDNDAVSRVGTSARRTLRQNAEKLSVAAELWRYLNGQMEDADARQDISVARLLLEKTIDSFAEAALPQARERVDGAASFVRTYFKYHVGTLGDLIIYMHQHLPALLKHLASSSMSALDQSHLVVYEANRIVIAALNAAFSYRYKHAKLYAISSGDTGEGGGCSWLEVPLITKLLVDQYLRSYDLCLEVSQAHHTEIYRQMSESLLPGDLNPQTGRPLRVLDNAVTIKFASEAVRVAASSSSSQHGEPSFDDDPYSSPRGLLYAVIDQLCQVINLACRCFTNRIAELRGPGGGSDLVANDALRDCVEQYDKVRPRMLVSLVPVGKYRMALRLSEEYRDFGSLVQVAMSCEGSSGQQLSGRRPDRITKYIDMYGKEFAVTLFDYYRERKAWWSLTDSETSALDQWLHEYFDQAITEARQAGDEQQQRILLEVAWVHDIKLGDYSKAAEKLTRIGSTASTINDRLTMLSLDKLVLLATLDDTSAPDSRARLALETLEDIIEFSSIHSQLSAEYEVRLAIHEGNSAGPAQIVTGNMLYPHAFSDEDREAVLDVAVLTTTERLRHNYPTLYKLYIELVGDVWNGLALSPEDLVDVLTLADDVETHAERDEAREADLYPVLSIRQALAINMLMRSTPQLSEQGAYTALQTAWRRIFLSDDWETIHADASKPSVTDERLLSILRSTKLYLVYAEYRRQHAEENGTDGDGNGNDNDDEQWLLSPADCMIDKDSYNYLTQTRRQALFSRRKCDDKLTKSITASLLTKDYKAEETKLQQLMLSTDIDKYRKEILQLATKDVASERLAHDNTDTMVIEN